jgi:hypothetical protein
MKNDNNITLQGGANDSTLENTLAKMGSEQIASVIPSINRMIEDIRSGYKSGSRIDVQIDWAKGRMAITY